MECDIIIYDITQESEEVDQANWIISILNNQIEQINKQKIFILVSTVMVWAKTKPVDPVSSGNFLAQKLSNI
jgi:adenylate kinase